MNLDTTKTPLTDYGEFLDKLIAAVESKGIEVAGYQLDHFGYQTSSNEDYDRLKLEFEKFARLISEKIVGGRRVGIYKFFYPLEYKGRIIPAIEIIAPKEGQICPSSLEHAEFVIDTDFETFVKKYPNLAWDTSKINQPEFPMVILKLTENTQVKFHLKPVLEIVKDN